MLNGVEFRCAGVVSGATRGSWGLSARNPCPFGKYVSQVAWQRTHDHGHQNNLLPSAPKGNIFGTDGLRSPPPFSFEAGLYKSDPGQHKHEASHPLGIGQEPPGPRAHRGHTPFARPPGGHGRWRRPSPQSFLRNAAAATAAASACGRRGHRQGRLSKPVDNRDRGGKLPQ